MWTDMYTYNYCKLSGAVRMVWRKIRRSFGRFLVVYLKKLPHLQVCVYIYIHNHEHNYYICKMYLQVCY